MSCSDQYFFSNLTFSFNLEETKMVEPKKYCILSVIRYDSKIVIIDKSFQSNISITDFVVVFVIQPLSRAQLLSKRLDCSPPGSSIMGFPRQEHE